MNLYGRTEDILEIQEGNLVDDINEACSIDNMNEDNLQGFITLISKYRHGQPNWDFCLWIFYSVEIFVSFLKVKNCILTILEASNIDFCKHFTMLKNSKFRPAQMVKRAVFGLLKDQN